MKGMRSGLFISLGCRECMRGMSAARCINSHITCETKNLIYMIQCNRCHLQYIGETKRRLKDRFNEQKLGFINGVDNVNWPPYRDSKS